MALRVDWPVIDLQSKSRWAEAAPSPASLEGRPSGASRDSVEPPSSSPFLQEKPGGRGGQGSPKSHTPRGDSNAQGWRVVLGCVPCLLDTGAGGGVALEALVGCPTLRVLSEQRSGVG